MESTFAMISFVPAGRRHLITLSMSECPLRTMQLQVGTVAQQGRDVAPAEGVKSVVLALFGGLGLLAQLPQFSPASLTKPLSLRRRWPLADHPSAEPANANRSFGMLRPVLLEHLDEFLRHGARAPQRP